MRMEVGFGLVHGKRVIVREGSVEDLPEVSARRWWRMLSIADAGRFLHQRYGSRAGGVEALGAGAWSVAYAFTLDGRDAVARFGQYGDDFAKDRRMGACASPRLPIPRVLDSGEAPGGHFAVSERVHGIPIDDLDGARMRAVLPSLFRALDALAEIDVSARRGFGSWGPDGDADTPDWPSALCRFAGNRLSGWRARLEASPIGTGPMEIAAARLQELTRDLPEVRHVIHGDLLHWNVFADGPSISGLIDWGNSLYGDALYDAAWLIFWWPWYPQWAEIDIRAEFERHWADRGAVPPQRELRLLCYQLRIGLEHIAYNAWTGNEPHLRRCAQQTLELAMDAPR